MGCRRHLIDSLVLFCTYAAVAESKTQPPVPANEMNSVTTQMGSYSSIKNKNLPGLIPELLTLISAKTGMKINMVEAPWKRALASVEKDDKERLIFPLIRTPKREEKYSWIVKILNDRNVFWARANGPEINSLNDISKYRIGVIRGSPFEQQLKQLNISNIDAAVDADSNARKLAAKRIDLWFVTVNTANETFRKLGLKKDSFKVAHTVSRNGVYIAGNKRFPPEKSAKIRQAFSELKSEGRFAKLLDRYKLEDSGEAPGKTSRSDPRTMRGN